MTVFRRDRVRDHKRYLWVLSSLAPAGALLPAQLVQWTGLGLFWWSGPIAVLGVIPLLDIAMGIDDRNPRDEDYEALSNDRYYRWCVYAFLPIQFIGLVIAGHMWASPELDLVDKLGLAATMGLVSGVGINAGHELGHRIEKLERWLAKIALAQSLYGHFYVEHNRGHHVRAATPEDPASDRFGESLWEFLPRTILGGFRSALNLERKRLSQRGKRWLSRDNNLLQAWAMSAVLFGVLILVYGPVIIPFLILQAMVGITLLETVNYIEHYGLLRARRADGLRGWKDFGQRGFGFLKLPCSVRTTRTLLRSESDSQFRSEAESGCTATRYKRRCPYGHVRGWGIRCDGRARSSECR